MQVELSARTAALLVSRITSARLSPVAKAASKHEPRVKALIVAAVRTMRTNVLMQELEGVLALGNTGAWAPLHVVEPAIQTIFGELFDGLSNDLLDVVAHKSFLRELKGKKKKLPDALSDAYKDGAKASSVQWNLEIDLTAVNLEAVHWAEQNAANLVANIASDTRLAIRAIVSEAFDAGMSVRDQARLIRAAVGLTDRDAVAVMRRQLEDLASGMDSARTVSRAERYSNKLLNARAKTIARTETMRASNEGQNELWRRAREKGLLSETAQKVWIAYDPCPICAGLSGETVPIDGEFSNGSDGPPAHPNCRCVSGLA